MSAVAVLSFLVYLVIDYIKMEARVVSLRANAENSRN